MTLFACTGEPQPGTSSSEAQSSAPDVISSSETTISSVQSSSSVAVSSSEAVSSSAQTNSSEASNPTANSLLSDGSFAAGLAQFETPNLMAATLTWDAGYLDFAITSASAETWQVELVHPVSVQTNTNYTLCFDAKTDGDARDIWFHIDGGEDSNWAVLSGANSELRALSASWANYQHTMMVSRDDATARVQFLLGTSDVNVHLDNIGLYEGTECGQSDGTPNSSTPAVSSSSAPVESSSVASSSSAPSGGEGNAALGQTLFEDEPTLSCNACHSASDFSVTAGNRDQMIQKIFRDMPPTNNPEADCDLQCATDIVAFLEEQGGTQSSASNSSSGSDDLAHIEGKAIFDMQCQSCHDGERTNGVFQDGIYDDAMESLAAKAIYNQNALSDYIAQTMPLGGSTSCGEDCADKVTAYIVSWHVLPINPQFADDTLPRNQPERKALSCSQPESYGERLVRLLTREEYANTVRDLFGYTNDALGSYLPQDDAKGKFTNNKDITLRTDLEYDGVVQLAEEIAQWSHDTNFSWLNCGSVDNTCAQRLVNEYGAYIFRRPLTEAEKNGATDVPGYLNIALGDYTDGDVAEGMKIALAAMLSSPQFLYRHEIGQDANGAFELSSYEMATFLSYIFTRSTPQPGSSLWMAAENGQLNSAQSIRAEAGKLLETDAAKSILGEFVHDWLSTRGVLSTKKDEAQFGNFDQVAEDMVTELSLLFQNIMLDGSASFADLYAPGKTYLNDRLAQHYGLSAPGGNGFQLAYPDNRGGLLLSGAFLANRGDFAEASPVRRATYIRRDMLCQYMPPPPADVSTSREDKKGSLQAFLEDDRTTNRETFHRLTEGTPCTECHAELINPLGFGLEDYDTAGRFRTVDNAGNPISATGAFFSPFMELHFFGDSNRSTEHYTFNGGQELAEMLATGEASGLAQSCLALQFYNYATGIVVDSITEADGPLTENLEPQERDGYGCDVNSMVGEMNQSSPRAMLEAIGTLESIRFRKAWSR
ncbi:MAG TPA: DUF1592 domain-containing protein [Marinagarivorans sp.]